VELTIRQLPQNSVFDQMTNETNSGPIAQVPEHELIRRIGRGSYGEVWLARAMTGVYRAIKIVHRQTFDDSRPFDRELAGIHRFEPISRSHEGLIDVLQVGQNRDQGYFYYVMELGDDRQSGQHIDPDHYQPKNLARELAARGSLPFVECLHLGLSLSHALAHLHEHGLIHRDIKPSNIIFVNGVPKLADIGLVADIKAAVSYVGTEGYIPPEGPGSPQSDVYSLGKVLYEISTGKDRHEYPQLPAQLGDLYDPAPLLELNEVIVKACQNDLRKRYATARDMHADLVALQNGKSVKRLRVLERRWQAFTRIGAISVVLVALGAGALYEIGRARARAAETRQRQAGAQIANGAHALEGGDLLGALPYFVEAMRLDHGQVKRERTHRARLNAVLTQSPKLVQMWFQDKRVNWVEFSPDGQRALTALWFGKAQVWNVLTGEAVSPPFGQEQGLETASFSPDGLLVVTASADKTACVWEAATGKNVLKLQHADKVKCAQFSPDGQRILTACNDRRARVWDARSGGLLLELGQQQDIVIHARFSANGRFIVTASQDNTARIWDSVTGKQMGLPLQHKGWVYYASFSPDGKRVVTAGFDRKARVWEISTGQELLPVMNHGDAVHSVEFSPDGSFIVTACWDGTARIWDANTQQPVELNPVLKHSSRVMHARFSLDGHRLVTACIDGTTRVWDLAASTLAPRSAGTRFSSDGSRCFSTINNRVQVWDTASSNSLPSDIVTRHPLHEAMPSRNGRFALTLSAPAKLEADASRELQVLDVSDEKPLGPSLPYTNALIRTRLSDDGHRLVSFAGKTAQVYHVTTGRPISAILSHDQAVLDAVFSPDGHRLLTIAQAKFPATAHAKVHVWDAETGRAIFPALKHPARVSHAQFSPDSRFLVTCNTDEYVNEHAALVWNAATGERIGSPLQHRDGVLHACFSPDSRRVVTASEDFTALVWDASSGRRLTPPLAHEDKVREACFSQDGRWIVTASSDRTARVWDADTGDPLTPPLRHATPLRHAAFIAADSRLFTADEDGDAWVWGFALDTRPINDLVSLSDLLSGYPTRRRDNSMVDATPRSPEDLRLIWQRLRTAYRDDFTVSKDEILCWHQHQAQLCEESRKWFAALFHFDCLLGLQPEDRNLAKRRAQAQEGLAKEQRDVNGTAR
jgi:WD40 repeat protein